MQRMAPLRAATLTVFSMDNHGSMPDVGEPDTGTPDRAGLEANTAQAVCPLLPPQQALREVLARAATTRVGYTSRDWR